MTKIILPSNQCLDEYILNCEFSVRAAISSNAYLFWKAGMSATFQGSRVVFLRKSSVPQKYQNAAKLCSDLSGLVLGSAFCSFTGLAPSHLTKSNGSNLEKILNLKMICGFKFVNLKDFYEFLGLEMGRQIYIEKCKFFSPTPLEKRIKLTGTLCCGYY